jgi:hypothetical protein
MSGHQPRPSGLDWGVGAASAHVRNNEHSTGGNGLFTKPSLPTKEMAGFLANCRLHFAGVFLGHNSPAEVQRWFSEAETRIITTARPTNQLFSTLSPQLANNWTASLTTMMFTEDEPARVTVVNNVLHQSVAEYDAALLIFGDVRRRFISPLLNMLLYELVHQDKRAEIAQALTQELGAVHDVGDVADYRAFRALLASPTYTLMETLEDAVWSKGVATALNVVGASTGATRTVVLAMRREQADLFSYATVAHAAAIATAGGDGTVLVFSMNDVQQMCARLVLGHHLKRTVAPSVLEAFRASNMLLVPAIAPATVPSVVLEVPMPAADANNVVQRQDALVKKGWTDTFGSAGAAKAKRAAPMPVAAEVAAITAFNTKKARRPTPPRADSSGSGGGVRPAYSAAPRLPFPGPTQRTQGSQQQGGAGAPTAAPPKQQQYRPQAPYAQQQLRQGGGAAAAGMTAVNGVARHAERSQGASAVPKPVAPNYICWNCAAKGQHTSYHCNMPSVLCTTCGFKHAPGRCLGYLRTTRK